MMQFLLGPGAGAIHTLCAGGLFDRARQLAGNSAQLQQLIEEQHTQHLMANNNAEELASRGNAAAAVEMFAVQGNWKRAHELVSLQPQHKLCLSSRSLVAELMHAFLTQCVAFLLSDVWNNMSCRIMFILLPLLPPQHYVSFGRFMNSEANIDMLSVPLVDQAATPAAVQFACIDGFAHSFLRAVLCRVVCA